MRAYNLGARTSLLAAATIAAIGAGAISAGVETRGQTIVPRWKHDPERLAAAEAKRARKAAKRLAILAAQSK